VQQPPQHLHVVFGHQCLDAQDNRTRLKFFGINRGRGSVEVAQVVQGDKRQNHQPKGHTQRLPE
jgi:hypothetical protein